MCFLQFCESLELEDKVVGAPIDSQKHKGLEIAISNGGRFGD
jgi:hypothetical protein